MNISGIGRFSPEQLVMNNPQIMGNPVIMNAFKMLKNGDEAGLKNMAENLMKERGLDENQMIQMIQNMTSKH